MSLPNTLGSTPATAPFESGGAPTSTQLQWVQKQLDGHSDKLKGFDQKLGEAVDSINALSQEEAARATKLALIENNVSHLRDSLTKLEGAQITEATLRALHTEMLAAQHKQHVELLDRMGLIQKELSAQIVATKDKAADDLRQHEERARNGRRWIIGLLITVSLSVLGLAVSSIFAYMRLKGG